MARRYVQPICGLYVDLNQIAAREVDTPEESLRTSAPSSRLRPAHDIAQPVS